MIIDVSHLLSWMDTLMWACDMVTNVITVGRGAATRCRTRSPRSIRPHWTIPERKNTECISSCELGICNEIRFSSHLCQMVLTRALLLPPPSLCLSLSSGKTHPKSSPPSLSLLCHDRKPSGCLGRESVGINDWG
jgi:hypothetical protein